MNIFKNMTPDDWENFAAYFLESIGYTILEGASVGPDGGKDLIAEKGSVRCLVSCKNNARSNKSVTLADEESIPDRMLQHEAEVFMGFYSTKVGRNLKDYLKESGISYLILESAEIAKKLADLPFMVNQSFFDSGDITQPKIFGADYDPLFCCCGCGCDLLNADKIGNSTCYLFLRGNDIIIKWYLNNHVKIDKALKEFAIKKFLYLKELNEVINEIELFIDTSEYEFSFQFDEGFTKIVELTHQMVYPSGWRID
ncbi:restriction endonuclease [Pantoea agglomerans]|uniref:restriction endonuclease n=1 Tax=Enterobacter agglomerans TaxID=549 RepID=UPI0032087EDE